LIKNQSLQIGQKICFSLITQQLLQRDTISFSSSHKNGYKKCCKRTKIFFFSGKRVDRCVLTMSELRNHIFRTVFSDVILIKL